MDVDDNKKINIDEQKQSYWNRGIINFHKNTNDTFII